MADDKSIIYILQDPGEFGFFVYKNMIFNYRPFYIGKGRDKKRSAYHTWAAYSNKHYNKQLQNKIIAIKQKTGKDPIVQIYKNGLTNEEAIKIEIQLIATIGRIDQGNGPLCNHTDGGEGISGRLTSDSTRKLMSDSAKKRFEDPKEREKISKANKGKLKGRLQDAAIIEKRRLKLIGHITSEKTKEKIRNSNKGQIRSAVTRKRISDARKGLTLSADHRKNISLGNIGKNLGKIHSASSKRNMSIAHLFHTPSEVTRQKLKEASLAYWKKIKENTVVKDLQHA